MEIRIGLRKRKQHMRVRRDEDEDKEIGKGKEGEEVKTACGRRLKETEREGGREGGSGVSR